MKIERIQKQGSDNVSLVFESGEITVISYEVFLKNGIKSGDDIPDEMFSELKIENEKYLVKKHAFLYLNRRAHSASELKLKLIKKGYRGSLVSEVISYLEAASYLNDNDFAAGFTEEKLNRYHWGKELISAGLRKKGISRDIITEVLKNIDPEDSAITAVNLLEKKYKYRSYSELESKKQKMFAFLLSKGYDYEISRNAVEVYLKKRNPAD